MILVVTVMGVALRVGHSPLVSQLVDVDELTAEHVVTAVEQLLPDTAPVRPVSVLRKGRTHASWVLDSAVSPLVTMVMLRGDRDVVRRATELTWPTNPTQLGAYVLPLPAKP